MTKLPGTIRTLTVGIVHRKQFTMSSLINTVVTECTCELMLSYISFHMSNRVMCLINIGHPDTRLGPVTDQILIQSLATSPRLLCVSDEDSRRC